MTHPVSILFLNPDPRPNAGSNLSLLSLISGLDARFHAVVATPANGAFASLLRAQHIEVVEYSLNNWWYPDQAHFFRTAAGFQARIQYLTELIQNRQLQLVHTNAEYAFEGALAAAQTGIPHIWNIRQIFGADLDILRFFPLSPQALGDIMARLSDQIVPNAHPLIGTFPANIPQEKFRVIASGINFVDPPDKSLSRMALLRRLNLSDDVQIIISMGRISVEKDLVTFIETARKLVRLRHRQTIHFVHFGSIGSIPYYEQLQTSLGELSPFVTFAGPTDTPLEMLRGADLLLFTSLAFEGLARVCLEALSMTLPVVATRCLGPEEYLLHGETALLAAAGDVDTLAEHVMTLLDDPGYANQLAQNGYRLVTENYNAEHVCSQWMQLYDELLIVKRGRPTSVAAVEVAINLVSLCGQLGERMAQHEKQLRTLERFHDQLYSPIRYGKKLIKKLNFFPRGE